MGGDYFCAFLTKRKKIKRGGRRKKYVPVVPAVLIERTQSRMLFPSVLLVSHSLPFVSPPSHKAVTRGVAIGKRDRAHG